MNIRCLYVGEEVSDELRHPPGAFDQITDELVRLRVQPAALSSLQHLTIERDVSQGLLQIVAGGKCEDIQVFIRPLQRLVGFLESEVCAIEPLEQMSIVQ